jgi:AGCS family alanine or glycine:cation symporter
MELLNAIDGFVWGPALIILLLGVGVYLTIRLRGLQFTRLGHAFYLAFVVRSEKTDAGDISHFQALMTALAATVGIGNIAGVATAIAVGGPGAVFWMWMTGLVGMVTKYAEALLAVKYRYKDEQGHMVGGPMVYIKAIGDHKAWGWLAVAFAVFATIASFGIGNMAQSNSVADALESTFHVPPMATGIVLAIMTGAVILGGIKWIGRVTSVIVPVMIIAYVMAAAHVLGVYRHEIPGALALIFDSAFSGSAAVGATIWMTIRMGVARGIFSNESGLGSAAIAAAAARTTAAPAQALVSMTQTFIDTIVVCTMTALVIICTGMWNSGENGASLTTTAFEAGTPIGGYIVSLALIFFAYSTLLGWSYYGEKALESIAGVKAIMPYRVIFCVFVAVGAMVELEAVWTFSDIANGLMAFPNLVALIMLAPVVASETKNYFEGRNQER